MSSPVTMTRRELYDLVWSKPMEAMPSDRLAAFLEWPDHTAEHRSITTVRQLLPSAAVS